jgi:hypothetical protein
MIKHNVEWDSYIENQMSFLNWKECDITLAPHTKGMLKHRQQQKQRKAENKATTS